MESFDHVSRIFSRFGVLCEILPFLGRYQYWKHVLVRVDKESLKTWKRYEHAFKQVDGKRPYETVSYRFGIFDREYMQYLKDPQICLNYKINVQIKKGNGVEDTEITEKSSMKYFTEFLQYCEEYDFCVLFDQISLNSRSHGSKVILEVYKMLYKQGLSQEKQILRFCPISYHFTSSAYCVSSDWLEELDVADINQALSSDLSK